MKSQRPKKNKLTFQQRSIIEYKIKMGETPQFIIDTWETDIDQRGPPSIQTIYFIKRQIETGQSVEPKKTGPKRKSVLTKEKLMEVEEIVSRNSTATFRELSELVKLPISTTFEATELLQFQRFEVIEEKKLTEIQKKQRFQFCKSFLCWNDKCKMMVWWSDESLFSLQETSNFKNKSYLAKENEYRIIDQHKNQKKINVWCAIRGDGNLMYEILEGIQCSENYIQLLVNIFPEMEFQNSFLMQDGAGIHTSDEAIEWINWLWKDRWIGLKSKRLEFPPYSMDLTPMDYSFWSYLKRKVATRNINTTDELLSAIHEEIKLIPKEVIIKMCLEVSERCRKCISCEGGRFERKPDN